MAERLTEQFGSLNPFSESAAATKKLRIASWNVCGLSTNKTECVAKAIKDYKFDIVAFQKISTDVALDTLCDRLNATEENHPWQYRRSQPIRQHDLKKLGFVWNSGIIGCEIVQDLRLEYFERAPYNLKFKFEDITH